MCAWSLLAMKRGRRTVSADNFYEVRKHPNGGFTYVMGFDSYPGHVREASEHDPQFADIWDAYNGAQSQWAEYPTIFHPECGDALRTYWGPSSTPL